MRELKQYICKDNSVSLRTLATKLSGDEVSHVTVGVRLRELGYKSGLPNGTPMLTADQKANRVAWATNHLNDQWERTLFSAFQLFRNTISVWYKGPRPIRPLPKNRQKVLPGVGFVPRAKPVYTVLQASWMQGFTQKFWRDIFQKSGECLEEGGDFDRIMTRSIQAG